MAAHTHSCSTPPCTPPNNDMVSDNGWCTPPFNRPPHAGATWLHVGYEPHLDDFYRRCGFIPTAAGLLRLPADLPRRADR